LKTFLSLTLLLFGFGCLQNTYAKDLSCCQEPVCRPDEPWETTCDTPCWQLFCHYEPFYYITWHRIVETVPYTTRYYRTVPKTYEVERCQATPVYCEKQRAIAETDGYAPDFIFEYYTETVCVEEQEYYEVEECRTVQRWCSKEHYICKPRFYWKKVCEDPCCNTPHPQVITEPA